jgi:hypothetical protein
MQIQDIHTLLTDIESNSQFADISSFAQYGQSGEPHPTGDEEERASERTSKTRAEGSYPQPATFPPPSSGHPGIFLIQLAVLAAMTCLRIDPWNEMTGYVHFIALHHWHPSFSIVFPDFL